MNSRCYFFVFFICISYTVYSSFFFMPDPIKLQSKTFQPQNKFNEKKPVLSPQLHWDKIPTWTESLVIMCTETNQTGKDLSTKWIVYNLSPQILEIPEGAKFQRRLQGYHDMNKTGFLPPNPRYNRQIYSFKIYALDKRFDFAGTPRKKDIEFGMKGHVVAYGELSGEFIYQKD